MGCMGEGRRETLALNSFEPHSLLQQHHLVLVPSHKSPAATLLI